MLEFPVNVYEEPLDRKVYASSFQGPVLYFLTDRRDRRQLFAAFALLDFARGRVTYITSWSEENERRLERQLTPALERHLFAPPKKEVRQLHSAISFVPDESFYAFAFAYPDAGFFYHVDYKRRFMRLILAENFAAIIDLGKNTVRDSQSCHSERSEESRLGGPKSEILRRGLAAPQNDTSCFNHAGMGSGPGPVRSFGTTFAKDPQDPRAFYLTAKLDQAEGRPTEHIAYYRVALDLGRADFLYSRPCEPQEQCPHATWRVDGNLLSSEFNVTEYQLLKTGQAFRSDDAFHNHVVGDYWSRLSGMERARAVAVHVLAHPLAFRKTVRRAKRAHDYHGLAAAAIDRCFRGTHPSLDFILACLDSEDYRFRIAPGSIRVLSLEQGAEVAHTVRHSKPAHFEVGAAGHVYLSCHTFFAWKRQTYFVEPAALLKLRMTGGVPREEGVFRHPTGYRFTSHVVFQRDGREYLCTVGQPNRLFLVDAETMQLVAFKDIGEDCLSAQEDVALYLTTHNLEATAMRAMAASEDGRYLTIGGGGRVDVVDLRSLDVVDSIPVADAVCHLEGCAADLIKCDALHCQRLS
jgi:hypothetical protein